MYLTYFIANINFEIKTRCIPSDNKQFMKSIRTSITRRKIDVDYSNVDIPLRTCIMCNSLMNHSDYVFKFEHISGTTYNIVYDRHCYDKPYGEWKVCKICETNKEIPKLKLNPNSTKFVKLLYGVDDESALKIIHERNKSKFYKINHDDEESYKNFQSHYDIRVNDPARANTWTDKKDKTYKLNKENFIKEHGIDAWKAKMREMKDSMSIDFHINKYGDNYEEKYLERIDSIKHSRPKKLNTESCKRWLSGKKIQISVINDFYDKFTDYTDDKGIISIKYIIDTAYKEIENNTVNLRDKSTWIPYSIIAFSINKDELYKRYGITDEIIKAADGLLKTKYGRSYMLSEDGYFFRSDFEYTLYKK